MKIGVISDIHSNIVAFRACVDYLEEEGCDEYFLLGDNETASDDSREEKIGNIKKKEIYGEVWFVIKPWSDIGFVSD
mgnify:CR=1 FL=1